jgi:hypothetical protein
MKTTKINMIINFTILALLIYLAVSVKTLQDKVFPDPNVMIPMKHQMSDNDFENAIKNLFIQKLQEMN